MPQRLSKRSCSFRSRCWPLSRRWLSGGGKPGQCLAKTLVADVGDGAKRGAYEAVGRRPVKGYRGWWHRGLPAGPLLLADDTQMDVLFVAEEGDG